MERIDSMAYFESKGITARPLIGTLTLDNERLVFEGKKIGFLKRGKIQRFEIPLQSIIRVEKDKQGINIPLISIITKDNTYWFGNRLKPLRFSNKFNRDEWYAFILQALEANKSD